MCVYIHTHIESAFPCVSMQFLPLLNVIASYMYFRRRCLTLVIKTHFYDVPMMGPHCDKCSFMQ